MAKKLGKLVLILVGGIFGIAFIAGALGSLLDTKDPVTVPKTAAQQQTEQKARLLQQYAEQQEKLRIVGVVHAVRRLQSAMRNPDSFKLTNVVELKKDTYVQDWTCLEYRAQNGFGGMNQGAAAIGPDFKVYDQSNNEGVVMRHCAHARGDDWLHVIEMNDGLLGGGR